MSASYWLGVDLGGTKILSALFDDNLRLLARSKQPTSAETGPAGVVERIAAGAEAVINEAGVDRSQIRGMGLGIPGQIVIGSSVVKFAPNLDWREVDVQPLLPGNWAWPVYVENDVRMGTFGEYAFGAARGAKSVLGVFVGTGVGGGLILNGELHTGFNGNGGEFGNLVVHWRRGHTVEAIAGRKFMMLRAAEMLSDSPKRVRKEWKNVDLAGVRSSQLAEFYQRDDPIAVQLVDDSARALGAAIGGVVNFISPEIVVIGGGVTGALGESYIERIWEIARRYTLPGAADNIRCVPAALGDDSGVVGCAAYAKSRSQLHAVVA
jgi:glucokinase